MASSSDSESSEDSDRGIRYKTDSIRHKNERTFDSSREQMNKKRKHHNRRRASSSSDYEEHERQKRKKEKQHKKVKDCEYNRTGENSPKNNQIITKRHKKTVEKVNLIDESQGIPDKDTFGPALPPRLLSKDSSSPLPQNNVEIIENSSADMIGPVLPADLTSSSNALNTENIKVYKEEVPHVIGPALPLHLQKSNNDTDSKQKDAIINIEPAEVIKENLPKIIGPALPPHLQKEAGTNIDENEKEEDSSEKIIGPTLPPHLRKQLADAGPCVDEQESDDDDSYGPLPIGAPLSKSHMELEERSWQLKIDQLNADGDGEPKREEWMLELPAVKAANLGLGPRTFRMKGRPDLSDRSSWTDTPQDKAKKKDNAEPEIDLKKEAERKSVQKRDREQEEVVKKSKRTSESLVDMHQKKMKEKKKEEPASNERRPFSRDVDLQVNRFDEAQKKAVLKKAQLLDDRFSSGQSKFL